MESILPIMNDPIKDDEGFFPLLPDMIRLHWILVRKRTVFNSVQDPSQERAGQERIKTLGLTEMVELQGPVPVIDSDVGAKMPGLLEMDSPGAVLLVLSIPATVHRTRKAAPRW